ncbi:hypothetical protein [Streptomyces olivaceus]
MAGTALRELPADDVVRARERRGTAVGDPPAVLADGVVLPADHRDVVRTGRLREMPVLAANTFEEGKLFGSLVDAYRRTDRERFTKQYFLDPDEPSPFGVRDFIADRYLPADGPAGGTRRPDG